MRSGNKRPISPADEREAKPFFWSRTRMSGAAQKYICAMLVQWKLRALKSKMSRNDGNYWGVDTGV
jgi:hypothetical protein